MSKPERFTNATGARRADPAYGDGVARALKLDVLTTA